MENIYLELLSSLKKGRPVCLDTKILPDGKTEKTLTETGEETGADYREYYYPEERLIILGGGHVSWPLALLAPKAVFRSRWWMTVRHLPTGSVFRRPERCFAKALQAALKSFRSPRMIMWLL